MSDWNGIPDNPHADGWHWLHHKEDLRPIPAMWNAALAGWTCGALHSPGGIVDLGYVYVGPCMLPADHAASVAAAVEGMREACEQAAMDEHRNREIELADMRGNKIRDVGAISFVAGGSGSAKVIASRIRALPIPAADALERRDDWQPIETAPKDGTRVLLWCVHANAAYSRDPIEEGWACAVIGQWIDHNGGGWTWHGLCGRITHWQPQPKPPAGALAVGEKQS